MKTFKGILLDLDHTLYDYHKAHAAGMNAIVEYGKQQFSLDAATIIHHYEQAKREIKTVLANTAASHHRLLYFQKMLEQLKLPIVPQSCNLYEIYWDTFLNNMALYDHVPTFFEHAQQKNKKICLVTNLTAYIQHKKIHKLNINQHLDAIVTSEEAGCEKPDPRIFMTALQKLNMNSNDICKIGDDFNNDIIGATNLGIYAFWLNTDQHPSPPPHDLIKEVSTFKEIMEVV